MAVGSWLEDELIPIGGLPLGKSREQLCRGLGETGTPEGAE